MPFAPSVNIVGKAVASSRLSHEETDLGKLTCTEGPAQPFPRQERFSTEQSLSQSPSRKPSTCLPAKTGSLSVLCPELVPSNWDGRAYSC